MISVPKELFMPLSDGADAGRQPGVVFTQTRGQCGRISLCIFLLLSGVSPASAIELTDKVTLGATFTGVHQYGDYDDAFDDSGDPIGEQDKGTLAVDIKGEFRPTPNDSLYAVVSFAKGNGLKGLGGLSVAVNADDLEDDVKDINGRGRDYLLEAYYEHTFEFDETLALALTAGLLDASQYIDHNALADDEIIQFMNEVFVSRFFLPTYDPGIRAGLSGAGWHTDLVWMDAATETPGVDPDGYHFLGVDFGFSLQLPMGEGHYDILLQSTDRAMTRRSGSERSTRIRGAGVSVDQAVSENLDVFVRLGANNEEAAALVHRALYSGGVRLKGQALALPRWTLGAAFAYLDGVGDQVGDVRRTRVFETYGRYALTDYSNISLDIQHVADEIESGPDPDAWILGVRVNVYF